MVHNSKELAIYAAGLILMIVLTAVYIVNDTNDPNLLISGIIVIFLSIGLSFFSLSVLHHFIPITKMI